MLVFQRVSDLQWYLQGQKRVGKSIGFSPTMGALHVGHLSLIEFSRSQTDISVASIFVNPTQFNDPEDLKKYPRTLQRDMLMLMDAQCDVLFAPQVAEVYPPGLDVSLELDFGQLTAVLEGEFRPGHFSGMATVVNRLLNIVQPDVLFMGQKDFQQFTIVADMLRQLNSPVKLVVCPIVREPDGLAMSSRNTRLTPEMRENAPMIFQVLERAKRSFFEKKPSYLCEMGLQMLAEAGLRPEYLRIIEGHTLKEIQDNDPKPSYAVAVVAAWAGDVRLIDNHILSGGE